MSQLKIDIVGSGNIAWHLMRGFRDDADAVEVNPHQPERARSDADFILICVKDDVIRSVAERLPDTQAVVSHTSGGTPFDALPKRFEHRGVFYPLNTFTKGFEVNLQNTPIFVEASDADTLERLMTLGSMISQRVIEANTRQREILHIAAVLSCNYVNRLWALSDTLLDVNGLDFDMLKPLIATTYAKMQTNRPADVQTGPASRRDTTTIERHRGRLTGSPLEHLYMELANNIMNDNNLPQ